MAKSRQKRLPGLESEPADAAAGAANPSISTPCTDPDAALLARMGADRTELPAEAIEATPEQAQTTPDLSGKTVYVVDAHNLIFQVFHAMPEMTGPRGQPTGAVFGFTRDMMYLLDQKQPNYLFAAFDLSGPTFRHELYTPYKEHRTEMPDALRPQIPQIRRVIAALGIPALQCEGYEADDVMATMARIVDEAGGQCLLVTGDKDCRQLITDRVKLYNVRKDALIDAAALAADWGIRPDQVVDFQSLVGDSVDNIPGVPLVGPKVAGEWLKEFDTLDNLLAHAEELPKGKRKDNLIASREQIPISRQLARLESHVPITPDWNDAVTGSFDPAGAAELFAEFGFHSLTNQMRERARNQRRRSRISTKPSPRPNA